MYFHFIRHALFSHFLGISFVGRRICATASSQLPFSDRNGRTSSSSAGAHGHPTLESSRHLSIKENEQKTIIASSSFKADPNIKDSHFPSRHHCQILFFAHSASPALSLSILWNKTKQHIMGGCLRTSCRASGLVTKQKWSLKR